VNDVAGTVATRAPAGPIPPQLHHIWLGPRAVPERWAAAWARRHPRWSHRVWREADIEPLLPDALRAAWSYYLERRIWHGAADVARIGILWKLGGVYADIDSEPVRSFDRAPFMRGSFFVGLERGTPDAPVHITNGVIGSVAGHPILADVIERIARADDIQSPWRTVGGGFLTLAVLAHRDLPGLAILPVRTFYPEDKDGNPAPGRSPVYTRQYWATTHRLYDHVDETWQMLAKRRRGEPIVPLRVRIRNNAARVLPSKRTLRRVLRAIVPKAVRRALRTASARIRRR
jgi:glycosyl transferase-like sugar-binding protein